MDFGAPSPKDDLERLERKVNRLMWLSMAQTAFLAIAVLMYVVSLASTYMFWITLILIVAVVAWAVRDKSPKWLKSVGSFVVGLMKKRTEHTSVTAQKTESNESVPMAG